MSVFSIFLEIAPVLPEVFENIFLSRYLPKPYPARSLKIRPALRDSLNSVHPCTLLRASFCFRKNSLLRGITAVRGGSETELRKKHHCSAFYSELSFGTKAGS